MPVVNGKHYPYNKKGKDAARRDRARNTESVAQIVVNKLSEIAGRPDPESPGKQTDIKPSTFTALPSPAELAAKKKPWRSGKLGPKKMQVPTIRR